MESSNRRRSAPDAQSMGRAAIRCSLFCDHRIPWLSRLQRRHDSRRRCDTGGNGQVFWRSSRKRRFVLAFCRRGLGFCFCVFLSSLRRSNLAEEHEHSIPYKTYILTWFWLLVLSLLALGLGYAPINERLKALLLVCTTLAKILVIAALFMHLLNGHL